MPPVDPRPSHRGRGFALRDLSALLARPARFRRHLRRMGPRIRDLRDEGMTSTNVLAILLVESFYRPRAARILEYGAWALLSVARPRRLAGLSVGASQLQLGHWESLGVLDGQRFTIGRLRRVASLRSNYLACLRFLRARGTLESDDIRELARAYAGGERPRYVTFLTIARRELGDGGLPYRRSSG